MFNIQPKIDASCKYAANVSRLHWLQVSSKHATDLSSSVELSLSLFLNQDSLSLKLKKG